MIQVAQQVAEVTINLDVGVIMGAIVALLGGLYAFVRGILSQASKDRSSDQDERRALINAIDNMAKSNEKIAKETAKGNQEAKERNGHLGEQNVQITKLVASQNEDVKAIRDTNVKIIEVLKKHGRQHVDKQVVEHQEIKHTD